MMRRESVAALVTAIGLTVWGGCAERDPSRSAAEDVPKSAETEIVGRIEPAEPGIGIIALQNGLETSVTLTDNEGRYRLSGLLPGEYSLMATGQGFFTDLSVRGVVVKEGQSVEAALITLRPFSAAATVTGHVLDAGSGKPLKDVRVTIRCNTGICANLSSATDESGRYEVSIWPQLAGTVIFQKDGYVMKELAVSPQPSRATHTLASVALEVNSL
jgi:hypothetical protein